MTQPTRLVGKARAKINLDLQVLGRRPDGYHNIRTLFARIAVHDPIAVESIPKGTELQVSGDAGGADGADNLAYQAVESLREAVGRLDGVRVELIKQIPTGAGLGGGSADAAATLRLVNTLWGTPLSVGELTELGGKLGADVPFLAADLGAAWGVGKGDELTSATLPGEATVLLATPAVHVGTVEAYRRLGEYRGDSAPGPDADGNELPLGDWRSFAAMSRNDFEDPVHRWHPDLAALHGALTSSGAFLARMSGSGAAHFALFAQQAEAETAQRELQAAFPHVGFLITHFE